MENKQKYHTVGTYGYTTLELDYIMCTQIL